MNEIRERLVRNGHSLQSECPDDILSTEVSPPRDIYVTVGLNLDPTLKPEYRERYFACLVDRDFRPAIGDDPDFDPAEPFRTMARQDLPSGGFMDGPFRWLLRRLSRFPRVVLWPEMSERGEGAAGFVSSSLLDEMPQLRRWLEGVASLLPEIGAIVLDLSNEEDCRVLWEVGNQVGKSSENLFVADSDCAEVYELHHHDKVVISIPDESTRRQLLDDLASRPDILEDCSGYSMEGDEEWGDVEGSDPSSAVENQP